MIRGCFISCRWNSTFFFGCCFCCLCLLVVVCYIAMFSHCQLSFYRYILFFSGCIFWFGWNFFVCVCMCCLCAAEMLGKSNENIKILNQSQSLHRVLYHRNFFFVLVTELFHNVIQQYPSKNQNNQKEMRFSLAFFVVAKP